MAVGDAALNDRVPTDMRYESIAVLDTQGQGELFLLEEHGDKRRIAIHPL
jgi:hypothetical protein